MGCPGQSLRRAILNIQVLSRLGRQGREDRPRVETEEKWSGGFPGGGGEVPKLTYWVKGRMESAHPPVSLTFLYLPPNLGTSV